MSKPAPSSTSSAEAEAHPLSGRERRKGTPAPPLFAQLLLDCDWRPPEGEGPPVEGEGWFRATGHAADRRKGELARAP